MSFKVARRQLGYPYTVINRLLRNHANTKQVSGVQITRTTFLTTEREKILGRVVRRYAFALSTQLREQ